MVMRTTEAEWQGNPREGQRRVCLGSGAFAGTEIRLDATLVPA